MLVAAAVQRRRGGKTSFARRSPVRMPLSLRTVALGAILVEYLSPTRYLAGIEAGTVLRPRSGDRLRAFLAAGGDRQNQAYSNKDAGILFHSSALYIVYTAWELK